MYTTNQEREIEIAERCKAEGIKAKQKGKNAVSHKYGDKENTWERKCWLQGFNSAEVVS